MFASAHSARLWVETAAHSRRPAGSTGACSGRNLATLSRNHRIDPSQPTRSANTVAGIDDVSVNSLRTSASNGVNDVGRGDRSYRGGPTEFTALITVVHEIPNLAAIRAFGSPSAASLRINAQQREEALHRRVIAGSADATH